MIIVVNLLVIIDLPYKPSHDYSIATMLRAILGPLFAKG